MNEKIENARAIALEILKPTQKELDHGLALHEDALVIEPYCLGLRSPAPPDGEGDPAPGHGPREWDHEQRTLGWTRTAELREEYRATWEIAGVDAVFQNAGEEGNDPLRLLQRFANYTHLIEAMPEAVVKIVKPDDILAARKTGRRAIGFACNGVPLPPFPRCVDEGLAHIRTFAKLGMRIVHLTYNRRNLIGDGCGERANGGLSDFGRHVIHALNRCGVMIDIAHTGWQSCADAIEESDRPVVVSHSTACGVHETIRGKPDSMIRALADTGGVFGVTNVPGFLGGSMDIAAWLDHIDYVVKHFGADVAAIGTDSGYAPPAADEADRKQAAAAAPPSQRPRPGPGRWEALWPGGSFGAGPERATQSLMWTNRPLLTVGMVQRGHRDETIRKILGGNILRVFREVWNRSDLAAWHLAPPALE